ncbi:MAG: pilus assembly protein TadG-related protein [Hyphomonadaceae bacterium]
MSLIKLLARFARAREGATAVLVSLSATGLIGATALATDVGFVYFKSRELQGLADLAALSAARDLRQAQRLAEETVGANRWGGEVAVETTLGAYRANGELAPRARFRAGGSANAVRVELQGDAPLFFAKLFVPSGQMRISRTATAAQTELAAFEIGSRLLSLRGGAANALLSGLTGSSVELSVMDYQALARANVDLFDYMDALRTELDMEAASFDQALDARIDTHDAIEAIANALAANGDPAAAAVRVIADAANGLGDIEGLGELIDLGPYGAQDVRMEAGATDVTVNALSLANAVLELANGARQVQLDFGAQIPGLADADVWLAIGERPNRSPWLTITNDEDVIIRTAQTRLYIEARVAGGLSSLASVRIPILVEIASAQARLSDIECGRDADDARVTLSVSPSIGMLALADIDRGRLNNFRNSLALSPAELVRTPLVRAHAFARVDLGGERWQDVTFTGEEIARGDVKTVATRDIATASVSSLLRHLELEVRVGGLGVGAGPVTAALRPALSAAAAPLDQLVNSLTDLLGVHLGEADVRVNGVRCDGAALVA